MRASGELSVKSRRKSEEVVLRHKEVNVVDVSKDVELINGGVGGNRERELEN